MKRILPLIAVVAMSLATSSVLLAEDDPLVGTWGSPTSFVEPHCTIVVQVGTEKVRKTPQHLNGELESTAKYMRLETNHQNVRYGHGLPPFKGNLDHRIIVETGLGLGLEKLTAVQLELFFNEFCPCGKEEHDFDDLRKLRNRILEDGKRAHASMTP